MLVTTTSTLQGKQITHYLGIVSGETIIGANVFRDFFAGIRDIVGGRSGSYEEVLRQAKGYGFERNATASYGYGCQCSDRCGFGL